MKSYQEFTIKLDREEKNKIDEAAEIFDEVLSHLVMNRDKGCSDYQQGLNIYDGFWKIYEICRKIDDCQLIP